jgi:predicted AlkP superfamily pyrophosphatase or phosphodiesterase
MNSQPELVTLEAMTARKILLIGIDGLRIDDALAGDAAPELSAFIERGRLHPVTMEVPTISGPGWSSILTGSTHASHGVFDNSFHGNRLDRTVDFLTRATHVDPSRGTFAAAGWPPLLDPQGPGPVIATRLDDQRRGRHRLVIRDGETYGYRWADGEVAAFSRLALRDAGPDASFVYLGEVDEAGHLYGGVSAEYAEAISRVDALLGGLLATVEKRAQDHDEDWLVGITTDHGHLDAGGHGGSDAVLTRSFLALGRFRGELDAVAADAVLPSEIPGILLAHLG